MKDNPLVSVIIPIYKVEPYLRDCVDSVIDQTYRNLEIILVDDGSPDNCPKMCDEYAQQDSRIKVIHKENGGLSDARNAGMKVATADYWSFVDSDDVCHRQMIEVLMRPILEDKELKMSACSFMKFQDGTTIRIEFVSTKYRKIDYNSFLTNYWPVIWAKVYHRSLFESIKFPVGRLHEDEFTTYKLVYLSKTVVVSDNPMYYYRQREKSIMSTPSIKRIVDTHDALKERITFFRSKPDEKYMYAVSIVSFARSYYNFKKYISNDFMNQWKKEFYTYPLEALSLKQKIKCCIFLNYPWILSLMGK